MQDLEHCKKSECLWLHRFEILGVLLIVIATILTIRSHNGIGILMLFLVGGALCLHKHFGKCHTHYHDEHDKMDCCDEGLTTVTKSLKTRRASKKSKTK